MTPKQIDREIARELAAIADHRRRADEAEARVRLLEELRRLQVHSNSVNTSEQTMQMESRLAISKGRSALSDADFFTAIRAAKPKGFTLRSLAKRIGEQPSMLSMQRKGDRPIPAERAKLIEQLTGWPADKKHWPGGLS